MKTLPMILSLLALPACIAEAAPNEPAPEPETESLAPENARETAPAMRLETCTRPGPRPGETCPPGVRCCH